MTNRKLCWWQHTSNRADTCRARVQLGKKGCILVFFKEVGRLQLTWDCGCTAKAHTMSATGLAATAAEGVASAGGASAGGLATQAEATTAVAPAAAEPAAAPGRAAWPLLSCLMRPASAGAGGSGGAAAPSRLSKTVKHRLSACLRHCKLFRKSKSKRHNLPWAHQIDCKQRLTKVQYADRFHMQLCVLQSAKLKGR